MKWYYHAIIIAILILFTLFFYQDGFGFISFLIAAVYLAIISYFELKRLKSEKSR